MNRRSLFKTILGGLASLVGLKAIASTQDPLILDIAVNGILTPIIIHNGQVVDGLRRLKAAKFLGIDNIPCTYV